MFRVEDIDVIVEAMLIECGMREKAEIARQESRSKIEKDNLEKEKSVLMGTASNQDNQDGALEITVSGVDACGLQRQRSKACHK